MLSSVNGVILAILALGFLIFIHELGHFLAAKRCGIRVDKFSIGFGPKLIGFKRGETEYCLSLLPFGGFVKMPGENPDERTGAPGEFSSAPVEHRIFVAIAGPAMNIVFGIIAFSLVYMIVGDFIRKSTQTSQIGLVADDSPAKIAGIRPGDKIIAIDGKKIRTWEDLNTKILTHPEKELQVEIIRDGQKQKLYVTPELVNEKGIGAIGQIRVSSRQEVLVHRVADDSSAAKAGIQPGDFIETINGEPIYHVPHFGYRIWQTSDWVEKAHQQFYRKIKYAQDNEISVGIRRPMVHLLSTDEQIKGVTKRKSLETQILSLLLDIGHLSLNQIERQIDHERPRLLRALSSLQKQKLVELKDKFLVLNLPVHWEITAIVQKEGEAANAGLQSGDQIMGVNGESVENFDLYPKLNELAQANPDQAIQIKLRRDGEELAALLTPEVGDENVLNLGGLHWQESLSGLTLTEPEEIKKYNIITGWGRGLAESWSIVSKIGSTLNGLITRDISPRYLAGPIGIVHLTKRVAEASYLLFLKFVGFISINLAIINLLPIPIADGGQVLFFILEKLRGKPMSTRKQLIIQQVSIVLIIGLFLYITWYDILRMRSF